MFRMGNDRKASLWAQDQARSRSPCSVGRQTDASFMLGTGKLGGRYLCSFQTEIWWEGNRKNGERTRIRDIVTRGRKQITELKKS